METKAHKTSVQLVHTDVTSFDSQLSAFKAAIAFSPHGSIDIVIPCAGVSGVALTPWIEGPHRAAETGDVLPAPMSAISVNLIGVWYTTQLALHFFHETVSSSSNSKQIVFLSSMAAYGPIPLGCDYTMSKYGVRGLWKSLRDATDIFGEGKPRLRVNMIAPSLVSTKLVSIFEKEAVAAGVPAASVDDVTRGLMRIITDEKVNGEHFNSTIHIKGLF